jgi:hypothetical protein
MPKVRRFLIANEESVGLKFNILRHNLLAVRPELSYVLGMNACRSAINSYFGG